MKPLALILSSALVLFVVSQFATSQDEKATATEASPSPQVFESGPGPVALVELFTSQGCSSCPPADTWLSKKIKSDDGLWKSFVPVAWHVDYWDRLGWPDPFGSAAHTRRQYGYREANKVGSVYTPGFLVNGNEWRGFFQRQKLPDITADPESHPRNLKATVADDRRSVTVEVDWRAEHAAEADTTAWDIHVAVLGFGLETEVPRGENSGRTLINDFVALSHQQATLENRRASFTLPDPAAANPKRRALAVWLTPAGQQPPIQATGGWLATANE